MPPVVIGAGIAAAGAVGAAAISNGGTRKAAQVQQEGNNAAIAAQQQAYNQSAAALAPWQQSGLQANALIGNALGFGAAAPAQATVPAAAGYGLADGQSGMGSVFAQEMGWSPRQAAAYGTPASVNFNYAPGGGTVNTPAPTAQNAFDAFLNSTNYKFQLGQGLDAVNSGYAGSGTLQSGAAMKGINDYAQNMAQGAYQNWVGNVNDLANRGFGAASAQAGVSQNLGNNTAALQSANANALANLQLQRAGNTASLVGGLGQIGGYVAGNLLKPSQPTNLLAGTPYG